MGDISSHGGEIEGALEPLRGNNIVLIGMRGSGKSTTAELLKTAIGNGIQVMDTDRMIEEKEGKTIKEIVDEHGEEHFRRLEDAAVQEAANYHNVIIATGGGAVERPQNRHALRKNSICIWLKANVPDLVTRAEKDTKNATNRFPLTDEPSLAGEVTSVLERRKSMYKETADETIETSGKSPNQVAHEIFEKIQKRKGKS